LQPFYPSDWFNCFSELNKQKKQGKAFKIAFFTLVAIALVVIVWQVNNKKPKEVKRDLENNSALI
jgi:hypothetical protein